MDILLLISGGFVGVLTGRILLKRWFNHLSIYSAIWTVVLVLYAIRLIQYNRIVPQAWFFIMLAWFVFYLGSITVICARLATCSASHHAVVTKCINRDQQHILFIDAKLLAWFIIILSMLAALSIIHQWITLVRYFGNFGAAITSSNLLYQLRVSGELEGGIPYVGAFTLSACTFAGIYTAVCGKLSFVGVLPLVLVGVQGIASMGRTSAVIAGVLFFTAFLYTHRPKFSKKSKAMVGVILVGAVIMGAIVFVSSTRGLIVRFEHESRSMETLRTQVSFLPSIYFYLSAPPVVFSEYLKAGGEDVFPGTYTLRPLFNVLSKFGLVERLSTYSAFYFTPEPMNAATYLRYLHADFGPVGIMFFPYILGVLLTILHFRVNRRPTLMRLVLLAHLFVIIFLSWTINSMYLGFWWVSIVISLFASLLFDCLPLLCCESVENRNKRRASGRLSMSYDEKYGS